jgi:hypothetical protein
MDSLFLTQCFSHCNSDPNVYILQRVYSLLFTVLYVDELLITRSSKSYVVAVNYVLCDRFSMSDLELLRYFLGLKITQSDSGMKMEQSKYALDFLTRFQMID